MSRILEGIARTMPRFRWHCAAPLIEYPLRFRLWDESGITSQSTRVVGRAISTNPMMESSMAYRVFCLVSLVGLCLGCGGSGASLPETTPVAFNAAGAPTVEFSVPDMMCPEGCAVKTKEILSDATRRKDVVVDFDAKTATVAIDEGKFDVQRRSRRSWITASIIRR